MAIENQTRIIAMRGTKADCGAFTANLEETALAFATDTGEIGIYTNGGWIWIGGGGAAAFTDLTDTFADYTGLGGQYLRVKATEDGLETGSLPSGTAVYPQTAMITTNLFQPSTGTYTKSINTAAPLNVFWALASSDTNYIETAVLLDAGTYNVVCNGATLNSRGKLDWSIDGGAAFISGQDWYNNSSTSTPNTEKTGTVTIGSAGRHLLRATVNGKNAASSGYTIGLTYITLVKQTLSG